MMMRAALNSGSALSRRSSLTHLAQTQRKRFVNPASSLPPFLLAPDTTHAPNFLLSTDRALSSSSTSTEAADGETKKLSYNERKAAAKERRRQLYNLKMENIEKRKHRRDGKIKGEKRNMFRKWFMKKKVDEEYMNRKARQAGLDWKLQVTVILQRYFILEPELEKWESDFLELKEKIRPYQVPWGNWPKELHPQEGVAVGDYPGKHKQLLARFPPKYVHPPSRITEADKSGNTRTIDRRLTENVFLVVKEEPDQEQWQFPSVSFEEEKDETLLLAARKCLFDRMGDSEMEFWCPSDGPVAVDMVALPEEERAKAGYYGTKNFFYKFIHYHGDLLADTMPSSALQDYAWLDKNEFLEHIKESETDSDIGTGSTFFKYVL